MSEWFKEHDWKSCDGGDSSGGSNPLLCAKRRGFATSSFFVLSAAKRGEKRKFCRFFALVFVNDMGIDVERQCRRGVSDKLVTDAHVSSAFRAE